MTKVYNKLASDMNSNGCKFSGLLQEIKDKYQDIYIILSPPRCSSTAFSRVFWEHPAIGYYCHEPFDAVYHKRFSLEYALNTINYPMNLTKVKESSIVGTNLVVKAMTFQVGKYFNLLINLTKKPIIFLIRDPRLSILSRVKMLKQGRNDSDFPITEAGWIDLNYQINHCQESNVPFLIVDSQDFRGYPEIVFQEVFHKLEIPFSKSMLSWKDAGNINLGNLGDAQKHWYYKALSSINMKPENDITLEVDLLSKQMKDHISACLEIYNNARNNPHTVLP